LIMAHSLLLMNHK